MESHVGSSYYKAMSSGLQGEGESQTFSIILPSVKYKLKDSIKLRFVGDGVENVFHPNVIWIPT